MAAHYNSSPAKNRYICNVNRTIRHIQYLLSQHDCVIIPGFGAMLARTIAAHSDGNGRLIPPSRSYSFNPLLKDDDGMLVHSIARQSGLSYEQARAEVEKDVAEMRCILSRQGQLSIGRIGILTSKDELLEFFPSAVDCITPMASWRPVIQLVATIERARDMRHQFEQTIERHVWRRRLATAARVAASVIVLLAVCIAVSTPVAVDEAYYASLYPEIGTATMSMPIQLKAPTVARTVSAEERITEAVTPEASVAATTREAAKAAESIKVEVVSAKAEKAVKSEEPRKKPGKAVGRKNVSRSYTELRFRDSDPYCLIVASLTTAEDAQKFIDDQYRVNPDMALAVLHKDGRYRVYAATGTSPNALQAQASDSRIARRYKGAWVCAR